MAILLLAVLAPTPTSGAEPSAAIPSASPDARTELQLREEEAVALVLAADPRFAGIADWSVLMREWQATFIPYHLLQSNYHVLSATGMDLAGANIQPRAPSSSIIAVTLVRDCVDPSDLTASLVVDPCGWRHTWYHRVGPDGALTLLFDEGDPDEAGGTPALAGTEWTLKAIGADRLPDDPAWLTFADDATVSGFSGCNVFSGAYSTAGEDIAIGPLRVSERICEADVMEIEEVFLEALQAAPMWWITGDLLKIGTDDQLSPSSNRVLTFQATGATGG